MPHELRFAGTSARGQAPRASQRRSPRTRSTPPCSPRRIPSPGSSISAAATFPHAVATVFAILHRDASVDLFIDRRKLRHDLAGHFGDAVRVEEPGALAGARSAWSRRGSAFTRSRDPASAWVFERLGAGGAHDRAEAPIRAFCRKRARTQVELEGCRAAHRRDGAALTRFLAWLGDDAPTRRAARDRRLRPARGISPRRRVFPRPQLPTISGAGPTAPSCTTAPRQDERARARAGYALSRGFRRAILDGTTDVTRTVAIGAPSAKCATASPVSSRAISRWRSCRFPRGTTGSQLDALARNALWERGLEFDHGTGHGVGSYLSVHEGPQRISKAASTPTAAAGHDRLGRAPGYYPPAPMASASRIVVALTSPTRRRALGCGLRDLTLAPLTVPGRPALLDRRETQLTRRLSWAGARRPDAGLGAAAARWLAAATQPLEGARRFFFRGITSLSLAMTAILVIARGRCATLRLPATSSLLSRHPPVARALDPVGREGDEDRQQQVRHAPPRDLAHEPREQHRRGAGPGVIAWWKKPCHATPPAHISTITRTQASRARRRAGRPQCGARARTRKAVSLKSR